MKKFRETFKGEYVHVHSICVESNTDLVHAPLWWHKQRLQQTRSGYGAKLTSPYKIHFNNRLRRIYVTTYSNAASSWFTYQGKKVYVH